MKLIELDDGQASPLGVTLSKQYNALSFSEDILSLNSDFESIGGPVDIDWMLRSAGGSLACTPGGSHAVYGAGKVLWNTMRLRNPVENLTQSGNFNSASAARMWMSEGVPLRQIFSPAVNECNCTYGN